MDDDETAAVVDANRRFYDAFENRDATAMAAVWEHDDRVVCTHPGWPILRGWAAVSASWQALFDGPQTLQFILTEERAEVNGDTAWVTVDENLISGGASGTVAALNLFVRSREGWLMTAHHGSSVIDRR